MLLRVVTTEPTKWFSFYGSSCCVFVILHFRQNAKHKWTCANLQINETCLNQEYRLNPLMRNLQKISIISSWTLQHNFVLLSSNVFWKLLWMFATLHRLRIQGYPKKLRLYFEDRFESTINLNVYEYHLRLNQI